MEHNKQNRMVIPGTVFRIRARAALKPMMPVVILCALIANLPSLAAQTLSILTGSDPMTFLMSQASTTEELYKLLGSNEAIFAAFSGYLTTERMLSLGLYVVSFLLSPVLMLGLTNALLRLLRGQEIEVTTVFSRMKQILKSIALTLLTVLKLLAWSVPGGAVMVVGMVLVLLLGQTWPLVIYLAGLVLMIAMMIRAMLHYSLATTFLADDPTVSACAAIRGSVKLMRYRKMELFTLTLSVYVWMILGSMVINLFTAIFGSVIGSTLSMALQLIISVYMNTCHCAFYEGYRQIDAAHPGTNA